MRVENGHPFVLELFPSLMFEGCEESEESCLDQFTIGNMFGYHPLPSTPCDRLSSYITRSFGTLDLEVDMVVVQVLEQEFKTWIVDPLHNG